MVLSFREEFFRGRFCIMLWLQGLIGSVVGEINGNVFASVSEI